MALAVIGRLVGWVEERARDTAEIPYSSVRAQSDRTLGFIAEVVGNPGMGRGV